MMFDRVINASLKKPLRGILKKKTLPRKTIIAIRLGVSDTFQNNSSAEYLLMAVSKTQNL